MIYSLRCFVSVIFVAVMLSTAYAQDISREQIKGLDEQVQEIKADALAIAAELNQLEEKLLYPSNTQISVFVTLSTDETFRLDSIEVEVDKEPAARHIYTFKELEALQKGGVQRLYTGNITTGDHEMNIFVSGKSTSGSDIKESKNFKVHKKIGPKIVEILLAPNSIDLKEM
ncbi:MAG: hypothetical protein ABFS03_04625 [Chloroflexota bacterium]